ncbi:MAG: sarcosine oxidase subunit delta family protein [Alphaproteobacteria bacterium]|nr:MAG: sarcosine oxidase subunit delta family protein [Alphaproteobacteria bacterium]
MLLIPCPYCGPRSETEFSYGNQAHIARPEDPDALSDGDWAAYVFLRDNTKGVYLERWVHSHGCRRWFNVARHTVSYEILAVYEVGTPPPDIELKTEI